jgi:septum formation protein
MITTLMGSKTGVPPLVLASGSVTRADILKNAGLEFETRRPNVDEASIRLSMIETNATVEACAGRLAELKALEISAEQPRALVIGADQILEFEGNWFEKPETPDQARAQLLRLSGGEHRLISSVSVALGNAVIWRHTDQASLVMRRLGDAFMDRYIETMGERMFGSVGGYQIEGLGAQLFASVDGDHYTILGLPLLPLLGFLRDSDVLGT